MALYRALDLAWYGASYRRANKLCENFGGFNFYDSDAGFRLSQGKSAEETRRAIEDLFLGDYARTMLAKTIQSCIARLEPRYREFAAEIRLRRDETRKFEADISAVRGIKDTRENFIHELKVRAKQVQWQQLPKEWLATDIAALMVSVEGFHSSLSQLLSEIAWLNQPTSTTLAEDLKRLESALKDASELREGTTVCVNARSKGKLSRSVQLSTDLERLLAYSTEPDAYQIGRSGDALNRSKARLEQLKLAGSVPIENRGTIHSSPSGYDSGLLEENKRSGAREQANSFAR